MSPKAKLVLGAALSALVNALVAFLAPEYPAAALAVAGLVLGALGVKRPGDASPAQVDAASNTTPPRAVVVDEKVVLR